MRLATFNLLHGRSLTDGLVEPERLAGAVAALDADVLGIQEVDHTQTRSGNVDLTALAAGALGAVDHRFAAAVVGTPGVGIRAVTSEEDGHGEPRYGIGLVSRFPVRSWHVFRLRPAPVRSPVVMAGPRGGRLLFLADEPRVVLAAVVDTPGGPLTVGNTHLSFLPGWNVRQLRQAVGFLRTLPPPRVLLGDLNLPTRAVALITRWRLLARVPTYPAPNPRVQLDHVLLDPRGAPLPPVVSVDVPEAPISDHRPLVVTLAG
ncbi:endonuclease/exonuclease/phosphatase family protein [Rhizomonospora bruguierae]|uniref:endonuclease/exonuclease/phosphatase family protein n=1 Tax=Rhizomonospora bruguierae TaxID=1581705 RepID=UPI001BCE0E1B|nr:endonuclease/exonuclease/phosphatase family protein [Micromonospora sp. NBRC 107566]